MENHGKSTSLIDAYPIDLDDFPYRVFSRDMIGSQQEGANMKGDLIFAQYGIAQPDHNTSNCQWRLFFCYPQVRRKIQLSRQRPRQREMVDHLVI